MLREAGVEVTREPAGGPERVRVRVPDGQAGRAHRALAAQMSRVARAAVGQASAPPGADPDGRGPRRAGRREADQDPPRRDRPGREPGQQPLVMERFREWGGGLALLLAVSFVAVEIPGPVGVPALLLGVMAVVALWWWLSRDGEGGSGEERFGPDA